MAATDYEKLLESLAQAHISGIKRGYAQGYADGLKDGIKQEQKRMDPVVSDGTRNGSSQCAKELKKRDRK